jgi:hypothetical protein
LIVGRNQENITWKNTWLISFSIAIVDIFSIYIGVGISAVCDDVFFFVFKKNY